VLGGLIEVSDLFAAAIDQRDAGLAEGDGEVPAHRGRVVEVARAGVGGRVPVKMGLAGRELGEAGEAREIGPEGVTDVVGDLAGRGNERG